MAAGNLSTSIGTSKRVLAMRAVLAGPAGTLSYRAAVAGWFYVVVSARRTASGSYTLSIDKT